MFLQKYLFYFDIISKITIAVADFLLRLHEIFLNGLLCPDIYFNSSHIISSTLTEHIQNSLFWLSSNALNHKKGTTHCR